MNWSYIAGFFDADGTLGYSLKGKKPYAFIAASQSSVNDHCLYVMRAFLEAEGIPCSIYSNSYTPKALGNHPMSVLLVRGGFSGRLRFLARVTGLLVVKKLTALRLISFMREWKSGAFRKRYSLKTCVVCKREFIPRRANRLYCDNNCKARAARQQYRSLGPYRPRKAKVSVPAG